MFYITSMIIIVSSICLFRLCILIVLYSTLSISHTNHVNSDLLCSSHISNCCLIHRRAPAWCYTQLYIFPLQYYWNSWWWKYRYQSSPHRYVIRNAVQWHLPSTHILSKNRLGCDMSWLLMHGDKARDFTMFAPHGWGCTQTSYYTRTILV